MISSDWWREMQGFVPITGILTARSFPAQCLCPCRRREVTSGDEASEETCASHTGGAHLMEQLGRGSEITRPISHQTPARS